MGNFCSHCQETVIDFRDKLPAEIYAFISQHKQYSCGTFHNHQLNRYYGPPPKESRTAIRAYVLAFAMGCLSVGQNTRSEAFAPISVYSGNQTQSVSARNAKKVVRAQVVISGTVTQKNNGMKLSGVKVILLRDGVELATAYTAANGSYRLALPKGTEAGKGLTINYSKYPFISVKRHIKDLAFNKTINPKMWHRLLIPKEEPVWYKTGRFL